jgi:hypothetical protein
MSALVILSVGTSTFARLQIMCAQKTNFYLIVTIRFAPSLRDYANAQGEGALCRQPRFWLNWKLSRQLLTQPALLLSQKLAKLPNSRRFCERAPKRLNSGVLRRFNFQLKSWGCRHKFVTML